MIASLAIPLALAALASTGVRAVGPSFDCARAVTRVEKTICADPALQALDAAVGSSYRRALERSRAERPVALEVRREHAHWLASREATLDHPDADLARYLVAWRGWLDAVGRPLAGFEGAWISGPGSIVIERRPAGSFAVRVKADDPVRGSYRCEYIGIGRLKGPNRLEVAWDTAQDGEDGADGWSLGLDRAGGLLRLTERRDGSEAVRPPFCGARGSLEGSYLPARIKTGTVRAWRTVSERS